MNEMATINEANEAKETNGKKAIRTIRGWLKDILVAVVIALIIMAFIKPTIVKEDSMRPTLYSDNFILLNRQAYLFSEPTAGDVIVFNSQLPAEGGGYKLLIKRVIALPGDIVTIKDGNVFINGTQIEEPYTLTNETMGFIENLVVPERKMFVMGDNRYVSTDSRCDRVGFVPFDEVVGRAFFRLHPFNSIGRIQ